MNKFRLPSQDMSRVQKEIDDAYIRGFEKGSTAVIDAVEKLLTNNATPFQIRHYLRQMKS